jgi:hypothetical protein
MSSAAPVSDPAPPPAEPRAIRACLPTKLVDEFDREWEIVLDRVKVSRDLAELHELLNKWRHTAYLEMRDPGAYDRMLAKADRIMATGANPEAGRFEDMQELIRSRRA